MKDLKATISEIEEDNTKLKALNQKIESEVELRDMDKAEYTNELLAIKVTGKFPRRAFSARRLNRTRQITLHRKVNTLPLHLGDIAKR